MAFQAEEGDILTSVFTTVPFVISSDPSLTYVNFSSPAGGDVIFDDFRIGYGSTGVYFDQNVLAAVKTALPVRSSAEVELPAGKLFLAPDNQYLPGVVQLTIQLKLK